ncbi:zinc ribbon domain-containing protein [Candidatus Enterococcus mansonii]|uniref:DZANK-type domain-containing protein n=1 Tax=Candidatus Enterococcus mansonii TaxID=1834181 RepID=A0A242CI75_9ENTE|nr:zinc ribbon domain-containing protein [Enterococcus sp. 4G2_DIV0659]OTO09926.1 hypothetical protein A5880_000609 [Enterococcus sp. 4G2_DIV0659]
MGDSLVQNQCTSCGGAITDPNVKHCPHCGTMQDVIQASIDEKNRQVELCPNCGSPVTFNIEKQQFACDFCHSTFTTKAEKEFDNLAFEADELVPFQVPEGLAKMKFYEWLIKGKNVPLDILDRSSNITLEQIYIPYMSASIEYEGSWGADIGYNRTEKYTDYETKEDKNGNKYSEPVTKTRTVTDWNHASDIFSGSAFTSYLISSELTGAAETFVEAFDFEKILANITAFDDHYTAGTRQLRISPEKASESIRLVRDFAREAAEEEMLDILPGDRNKNAKLTTFSYELTSKYVYVPFWKISYKYEGIDYFVVVTASSKEEITMDGSRPTSEEHSGFEKSLKKKGRFGLLGVLISLPLFYVDMDILHGLGFVLLIAGMGVWLYFAVQRFRFNHSNKKQLKSSLEEHMEYKSLAQKYQV